MSTRLARLSLLALLASALPCFALTHYVDVHSTNAVAPYTNWATAANVIQDAVDAAVGGDTVLVTHGVYDTGGKAVFGTMTNRVAVDRAITLQSLMGPEVTIIEGQGPVGNTAIRCVYLTSGASLSGFTLTNGGTLGSGDAVMERSGGGAWCEADAVVTNSIIAGNAAHSYGGGVFRGTLVDCVLNGNVSSSRGGGAYDAYLSNCSLIGNFASSWGGGAIESELRGCTVMSNSATEGGGAMLSALTNSTLMHNTATSSGGGARESVLDGCLIVSNSAPSGGGTIWGSTKDCFVTRNSASNYGGGVYYGSHTNSIICSNSATYGGGAYNDEVTCLLIGCLLFGNTASYGGGASACTLTACTLLGNSATVQGGGSRFGTLKDCILYHNTAPAGSNWWNGTLSYTCTVPLPSSGTGNITNAPLVVNTNGWADLRLQSNSPCINAGNNAYVASANDLDGNPRIVGGTVDMGAYEFQSPASTISYAWLQQYDLPIDGSVDDLDGDGDKATTWQEWKMWTNPTNELSVLRMLNPDPTTNGTKVAWQSVAGHSYALERAADPAAVYSVLQSNIVGQAGMTSFDDTTATNGDAFFYRVSVPE